jgi:membrane-associated phospholipid phosphatase
MLIVTFNIVPKVSASYIWVSLAFISYSNATLKSIYSEPRPFWTTSDIKPSQCRGAFGNPSGHCMGTSFFWVTLLLHKYYEIGKEVKIKTIFCTAYIVKMALIAGLMIFLIFLAISRVYLGEHTWNEVLFGLSLGTSFAFLCHYYVKPYYKTLPNYFKKMAQRKGIDQTYYVSNGFIGLAFLLVFIMPLAFALGLWYFKTSTA